jgi:hypothetical protein
VTAHNIMQLRDKFPARAGVAASQSFDDDRVGRRRFLKGVGATAAAAVAVGHTSGTAHAAPPAGASQFVALPTVTRVLDTRTAQWPYQRLHPNAVRVALAGQYGIPANASAIVGTLTAVNRAGGNWVTALPAGTSAETLVAQNRLVSMLNLSFFGQAAANLTQVKLASGALDLVSLTTCELVLDVVGYYVPVTAAVRAGRYVGLPAARRAVDTRETIGFVNSGTVLAVDLTAFVPPDASSAVINLTATECTGAGFLTVYPATATSVPTASTLNVNAANETRAASAIVPISTLADGRRLINVFVLQAAKVIVDVTGYFTGASSASAEVGLFVPADPVRILDTRDPGQIGRLWPGWTVEGAVPGPGGAAGSIAVNLTAVSTRAAGFLTVAPARVARPGTSNVNFTGPGQVVPNHAITPVTSAYGLQVFAAGGAHVLVDYMGYYTGTPTLATTQAPVNPPPPAIGPEWFLEVPAIGLQSRVLAGDATRVTDSGSSWHWTGTGFLGQDAHIGAFAHRTSAGGPYRYVNYLSAGDQFILTTGDNRQYVYEVVRRDLTDGNVNNILAATRFHPGPTFSLIACTKPDFTPTSTSWRIIVTAQLLSWRELV